MNNILFFLFFLLLVWARVFARWPKNGLYYCGFVKIGEIKFEDGNILALNKNDPQAMILDKLSCYSGVKAGKRIIGFWLGTTKYYPGTVLHKNDRGSSDYYQGMAYAVKFHDSDERTQAFYEIRILQE